MPKDLATKFAQTAHALRRNLVEASHRAADLPDYLDPLIREMRESLDDLERRRSALKRQRSSSTVMPTKFMPRDHIQKREAIIEVLDVLQRPATPATVSRAARVMFQTKVEPSQFASLRKGDERAYMRGRRTRVMLVPALSAVDLTARPGTITLSTWPVERRIIGQRSERVDAIHTILRLLDLTKTDPAHDWWSVLQPMARDFGLVADTPENVASLIDSAHRQLEPIEGLDFKERHEAAERAAPLPDARRLFGAFPGINSVGTIV